MDYLASARTREEILNDPLLCHFLQNPYLKDNMELALKFKEAKRGGYNEKREFLEHFFCNGPELEPDTILYYRDKCSREPIYLEIAQIEFANFEIVDAIREKKYGKKSDNGDCYSKPCNYLAPLSKAVGLIGDANNFLSLSNIFAKNKKSSKGKEIEESAWGGIRQHMMQMMLPNIQVGCQMLYNNMKGQMQSFLAQCDKAGISDHICLGDPVAIDRSEMLSSATKINTANCLGDCVRLWQHMRQFNPYDPKKNTKGPIEDHMKVDNKETDGSAKDSTPPTAPIKYAPPSVVKAAANKGDKLSIALDKLNNLKYPITDQDIKDLLDENKSVDEKMRIIERLDLAKSNGATNIQNNWSNQISKLEDETQMNDSNGGWTDEMWEKFGEAKANAEEHHSELWDQYKEIRKAIVDAQGGSEPTENEKTDSSEELASTESESDNEWSDDSDVELGSETESEAERIAKEMAAQQAGIDHSS